jgi:hypothetical protein
MTTTDFAAYEAAAAAHKEAWKGRKEQRAAILARFGVTIDESGSFGLSVREGIAAHWDRLVRLEFSSCDGWQAGTSGTICDPTTLDRFILEAAEVRACIQALQAMGDTAGTYLPLNRK